MAATVMTGRLSSFWAAGRFNTCRLQGTGSRSVKTVRERAANHLRSAAQERRPHQVAQLLWRLGRRRAQCALGG